MNIAARLLRSPRYNKAFQGGTLDGFTVAALDGTELTLQNQNIVVVTAVRNRNIPRKMGTTGNPDA